MKHRPNVIALGYDQFVFTQKLQTTLIEIGLDAEIIRLNSYLPEIYKTSLLKKLKKNEAAAPAESTSSLSKTSLSEKL